MFICLFRYFFFFKQKTAYEMRISDWSSDVCSSDLVQSARLVLIVIDRLQVQAERWPALAQGQHRAPGRPVRGIEMVHRGRSDPGVADAARLEAQRDVAERVARPPVPPTPVPAGERLHAQARSYISVENRVGRSEERRVGKECVRT